MAKDVKREMKTVRRDHAKRQEERAEAGRNVGTTEPNYEERHNKNIEERQQRVAREHNLNVRNKIISDVKHPDLEPEEVGSPQKGKDIKHVAEGLAEGKRRKLANEAITPAWNRGFKKEVVPQGYRIKQQIGIDGRLNTQFEKIPELKDAREVREESARTMHMNRAIRGFDPEQARMNINQKIESRLDNVKEYIKWMDNGGIDVNGLKEHMLDMKVELEKYGHTELADLVPVNGNREQVDEFIKTMNKRLGIRERKELPGLVADKITRIDGVEQEVWHIPAAPKKKKLNIRPGYIKEPMERLHGHEGRENDIVRQMKWSKDPDFLKVKGGIINQGDWKFDSNQEISAVHRTKGSQGFEYGGVNPSAIVVYKDGSRAFIKKEDPIKLRREYGVSKFYNTVLKKNYPDVFDFNIPRSNIVDLKYMQNDDVYDTLGSTSGEVIRNEYVEGYPMDIMLDSELLQKVKPSSLIKSFIFNMVLGNNDYHAGNVLLDSEGNITVIDTANALESITKKPRRSRSVVPEDYSDAFKSTILEEYVHQMGLYEEYLEEDEDTDIISLFVEEHLEDIRSVIDSFRNMDDETVFGILQNTEIDDTNFEEKRNTLLENLDFVEKYYFGNESDKEYLANIWKERFEETQREAEVDRGMQKPDTKAKDTTESSEVTPTGQDEDRLTHIRQANEDRDRLKKEIMEDLMREFELVPKKKEQKTQEQPTQTKQFGPEDMLRENMRRRKEGLPEYKSLDEMNTPPEEPKKEKKPVEPWRLKSTITEDEYNEYMGKTKPKIKYEKYTDDDISHFQEIQEEQAGIENNWLMQTLAAKAFGLPEDNVDENLYNTEIQDGDIEVMNKIWSATQDQLKEEYPDGFIELYRMVDRKNLPEAESGDVVQLPVRNVSYWAEKDDIYGDIGEVLRETLEDPILVKAMIPIESVLYTPSIINTGEWREYGVIGTNIDSSLVDDEEDSGEEE